VKALTEIEKRKERHLRLSLDENVQSDIGTGFEDVRLIHRALPEIDLDEIDTEMELFGKKLSSPLIVSAITGGTGFAKEINSTLAEVAEELGIGIGVGSQRIALEDPQVEHTFTVVRDKAPSSLVMGNIGCPQLSLGWGVDEAKRCVDMIGADALGIHMNPLQEAVQVGGDTQYRGVLEKIGEITGKLGTPVVMKETGCGISKEVAVSLEAAGASALEVSGVGGTSWAAVEHHIARVEEKKSQETLGEALWNWGIPTAISVVETADAVGIAKPFLEKAVEGKEALREHVEDILREFRTVMFLVGAGNVEELKKVPVVVLGRTSEWLRLRGYDLTGLANRG
jgi:isopentenyl-diphosphate delta-isomerase